MTIKEKMQAELVRLANDEKAETCYQKAKIGCCSGKAGKWLDVRARYDMGVISKEAMFVKGADKVDIFKYGIDPTTGKRRRYKIETKSRNGTIGEFNAKGVMTYIWEKNDFICYAPLYLDVDGNAVEQTLIIPAKAFRDILVAQNLIKKTSKKNGGYKMNIQDFSYPKRKKAFLEALSFEAMDWELWKEIYQIKF